MSDEQELRDAELAERLANTKKTKLEIMQLGLAWWKRPAYLGALIPVLLALITLVTVSTRVVQDKSSSDAQRKRAEEALAGLLRKGS